MSILCLLGVCRDQKSVGFLELELQAIMSHHMSAGIQTWVLCNISKGLTGWTISLAQKEFLICFCLVGFENEQIYLGHLLQHLQPVFSLLRNYYG